jgi:hypothetical protein
VAKRIGKPIDGQYVVNPLILHGRDGIGTYDQDLAITAATAAGR